MSASANSRADSDPGTPHIAGRSGDIRRERAVLIEERNHCPEGFECAAGADSELQRRIFLQAQIDRLRRMHQLDGDDPEEVATMRRRRLAASTELVAVSSMSPASGTVLVETGTLSAWISASKAA